VKKSSMSIAPGVIVETIGDDVVVMVPESTEVIRLSGDAAQLVRAIHDGPAVAPTQTVTELINRGILVSPTGMSRRGLITAGAIGAGAGITALAMPGVAAASSSSDEPGDGRIALLGDYYLFFTQPNWYLIYNTPALVDPARMSPPFAPGNEAVDFDPTNAPLSDLILEGFGTVDNGMAFLDQGVAYWQENVGEDPDSLNDVLGRIGSLAPRTGTFEVGDGRYRATFTWQGDLSS